MTLSPGPSTSPRTISTAPKPPEIIAPRVGAPRALAPLSNRPLSNRSTPAILRLGWLASGATALLFGLAMANGVRSHRAGLQAIGRDAGPSIIQTQAIKGALSDMDANLINQLLVPTKDASRQEVRDSIRLYEERRGQFSTALIAAAENITYGDAERNPITSLQVETGNYERLGAQALLAHAGGDDARARGLYQRAETLLQGSLLPAAAALDKANNDVLQRAYDAQQGRARLSLLWLWLSGTLLLATLIALQMYLAKRTRRTFNIGLSAATLLALALLLGTTRTFGAASEALRGVKKDAFDSVSALSRARATAFDLNADESRWLFLPAAKPRYEQAFLTKVSQLATLSPTQNPEAKAQNYIGNAAQPEFQGYFATELRNITFTNERNSANRTLSTFAHYLSLDPKIRALDNAGRHADAVNFCISYGPGQSNEAYSAFVAALDDTLKINTDAFKRLTDGGFAGLQGREWLSGLGVLGLIALTSLGLRPRLREYGV